MWKLKLRRSDPGLYFTFLKREIFTTNSRCLKCGLFSQKKRFQSKNDFKIIALKFYEEPELQIIDQILNFKFIKFNTFEIKNIFQE